MKWTNGRLLHSCEKLQMVINTTTAMTANDISARIRLVNPKRPPDTRVEIVHSKLTLRVDEVAVRVMVYLGLLAFSTTKNTEIQ